MKRFSFLLLLILCSALLWPACALPSELDKVTLQLKWRHQFQFAGYYAAIEKGFYRDAGLEVVLRERTGGEGPVALTLNGSAEYGIDGVNLVRERMAGKPIVALAAIFQHSPSVLVALKEKNIRTPQDLLGKKVMANHRDVAELTSMLVKEGLDKEALRWVARPADRSANELLLGNDKEIDALNVYLTNEPFYLQQTGLEYSIIDPVAYGVDFYSDILFTTEKELLTHPSRVKAFREASLKGWQYATEHPEEIIDLILRKYSPGKSREQLLFEASESIKLIRTSTRSLGHINPDRIARMAEVLDELGETVQRVHLKGFVYNEQQGLRFTEEERAWLAQDHVVRARVGNAAPYHSSLPEVQGMSVDYLDAVAKRAGFKVKYVSNVPWAEALNELHPEGRLDLLLTATVTPLRRATFVFTKEYLESPSVIFTRQDSPFVGSIDDLAQKTVVVEKAYVAQEQLAAEYPRVRLLLRETTLDALKALAAGEADAYIGNLTMATYLARVNGISNVKVAAPSPFGSHNQSMVIRNDWPELASIIDKTLATLTPEEHSAIRDRWMASIQYQYGMSSWDVFRWIAGISAVLLAVIAVILIWNKKLTREIEARAVVEDQLRQSEEKYRTLFERSTDAILIIKGDRFIDCNEATLKMLGYATRDEFLGSKPGELSPPIQPDGRESGEKAAEMMAIALEEGSHRFEWLHTRANGEVFPAEILLTAISKGEEPVLHVVWRDITVRKQADEALLQLSEDLTRKNIELERFTYTVSHDLKSPLITIQGFSGVLAQSLGENLNDDVRSSLGYIDSAAKKMYALLEDLLELSRIGRVVNPHESVSLGEIAREALELLEGRLVNNPVTIGIADDLPRVTGDHTRLREVMQNLIENAVKYMGDQAEPHIEIGVAEVDGEQACFVRDNGMGIAERYKEKVFGLFERLNADGEGTGVGLTLVKRIVELHGGRIWIESAGAGQGTTVWFTLPWEEND